MNNLAIRLNLAIVPRSIFIVDQDGTVLYIQLVKEIGEEPNYDQVLGAVKKIVSEKAGIERLRAAPYGPPQI
ncbi:MAG: hypothetical protein V2I56_04630 [Desulfobacteraceae bacterium]|jgi:thiol peroxidase|nr:hypothetical protein [Desulfobacteraceae bacterium]